MEKIVFALAAVAVCCVNAIGFPNQADRITTGNLATGAQFPYMVSLQQLSFLPNQLLAHRCGGAMITLQHALTAAQCTFIPNANLTAFVPIVPSEYRLYGGNILLSNDNLPERIRTIANYTVHPEYLLQPALLNDIAIITTTAPFLNTTVVPIPLPSSDFIPEDFTVCSLAGWGAADLTSLASDSLRYATKYTYKHSLCTHLYNTIIYSTNIHPSMLCAASYDMISVGCSGDAGNPLVCDGQLTGVLSLTNQCIMTSYPEVYTRVSNYTTWIRSITGGASSFKPELALFALVAVVYAMMFS